VSWYKISYSFVGVTIAISGFVSVSLPLSMSY
jgi:hypothetical protein